MDIPWFGVETYWIVLSCKQPRKRSCRSSRLSRVVLCHHWWGGDTDTEKLEIKQQGRHLPFNNDNDSLHRWNMTKHTGFQSFLIFSYLFYITIFTVIWFCRHILGRGRSHVNPFQRFGHQDSDSESSFGSYSEDDEEPAVPAPFGEPKKTVLWTGRMHPDSCHFPKESIIELEMDWLCWNYFSWILKKCGNDRRQNFLFNGVWKVQHWFRVAGQRRCSHKDEELRWPSRWTKELPASHTNLNTPRLLGSFVDIHHFSVHPPSHFFWKKNIVWQSQEGCLDSKQLQANTVGHPSLQIEGVSNSERNFQP